MGCRFNTTANMQALCQVTMHEQKNAAALGGPAQYAISATGCLSQCSLHMKPPLCWSLWQAVDTSSTY
jgi:hypothetical protein